MLYNTVSSFGPTGTRKESINWSKSTKVRTDADPLAPVGEAEGA